jgi:hypothetical protein
MRIYQSRCGKLNGTSYAEIRSHALLVFKEAKKKTKRRPYIRSAYFKKQKVFFDYFWTHLFEKSLKERVRRLKYLSCAMDLIKNSRSEPISFENPNRRSEILHRFAGLSKEKELFFVQIKEDKKTGNKFFMSVFPQ